MTRRGWRRPPRMVERDWHVALAILGGLLAVGVLALALAGAWILQR